MSKDEVVWRNGEAVMATQGMQRFKAKTKIFSEKKQKQKKVGL
jgi:hypothetical protein